MKTIKQLLTNKLLLSAILILIQVIWIVSILVFLRGYSRLLQYMMTFISVCAVLYIVNKDDESGYKIVWLILILSLPVFGGLLYLCFGNKQPAKKMRYDFDQQLKVVSRVKDDNDYIEDIDDLSIKGQMNYLISQNFTLYKNQGMAYYPLGDDAFPCLIEELKKAKEFIFMEYFIVDTGEMFSTILDILKQKVKEGVEVRFMYDDVGSITMLPRHYYRQLQKAGIQCVAFNPFVPLISLVMNNRDHRKITVIDGQVGFTGGYNLADEYINRKEKYGHWKDSGVMIKGESVWTLTTMFLSTWNVANHSQEDYLFYKRENKQPYQQGYIIPYGDSPLDNETLGETVYLNMINQATDYVYIDTPYLILNNALQRSLVNAVKRGVDVRITTPGIPDKKMVFRVTRSYYPSLIRAGVKIYEYTPGFNHSKNVICDDKVATVGTINFDYRSLYLHFECGVYMYHVPAIQKMKEDYLYYLTKSKEMTKKDIEKGRFRGLYEAILRVFAPLL